MTGDGNRTVVGASHASDLEDSKSDCAQAFDCDGANWTQAGVQNVHGIFVWCGMCLHDHNMHAQHDLTVSHVVFLCTCLFRLVLMSSKKRLVMTLALVQVFLTLETVLLLVHMKMMALQVQTVAMPEHINMMGPIGCRLAVMLKVKQVCTKDAGQKKHVCRV